MNLKDIETIQAVGLDYRKFFDGLKSEDEVVFIGGDGTIGWLAVASPEPMAYCMALIDNALNGTQYADWTNARIDSSMYIIDSPEDAAQVKEKSVNVTYDPKDLPISAEVLAQYITRINPEATYASLMELLQNPEYTSVDALYNR